MFRTGIIWILLFTVNTGLLLAQNLHCTFFEKEHIDEIMILGYHHFEEKYVEIGVGSIKGILIPPERGARYMAEGPIWNSISMSMEFRLFKFKDMVIGPQLSYWSNFLFAKMGLKWLKYGVKLIAYTNTKDGNLVVRPEIGIINFYDWVPLKGGFISFVYGYNFVALNPKFGGHNTHDLAVRFYFKYR